MLRKPHIGLLLSFALLLQIFAPGLAMANGGSPSLLCNPTGQVSAELQAGLDDLKAALGIEDETVDVVMDCQDCIASVFALPSVSTAGSTSILWTHTHLSPRAHPHVTAQPRGPPLGSRAPPISL